MTITVKDDNGIELISSKYDFCKSGYYSGYLDEFRCVAFLENGCNVDFNGVLYDVPTEI